MVKATPLKLVSSTPDAQDAARLDEILGRYPQAEAALVRQAFDFAEPVCRDRRLASGEPLVAHVLGTASILAELRLDHEALAGGILRHCHEGAPDMAGKLREKFGPTIAALAEGVARMEQIGGLSAHSQTVRRPEEKKAAQLEGLRKMLLAMVQDIRVVLIKIADHTQDVRFAVKSDDEALRRSAAALTFDIFAPLANRLGVWRLKWELEDLAFRIREAELYKRIAGMLDEKRLDREQYIDQVIARLRHELEKAGVRAEVTGRPKHIYSIYRKMRRKGVSFEALHDVRAVRVLVEDAKDCYAALGLVHHLWTPIPKEFDDYIAKPKPNNYRSLHTAVIGPEGKALEVQIRTHEMHQHSELGVAAHWRYKEGTRRDTRYDEKIAWLRQVLEWRDELADAGELAEQFKTGLIEDTIYVLTPQGRVIDLPKGATPIDFAYHVHTELGHRCRGAKVDGVMVPLNTPLTNGQAVEIHAAKQGGPSRDWLNPALGYLKSHAARIKVRQWFNRQNYETAVAQGRALLDKELQRQGLTALNLENLARALGFDRLNDFLAEIGRGGIGPQQLKTALRSESAPPLAPVEPALPRKPRAAAAPSGILIVGVDKLLTVPAKCCKPAPPDRITGFVTRGRGVTIHRQDCANVLRLDPQRMVAADWGDNRDATFAVDVEVEATDRTGLLRDISEVLSRERINVTAANTASRDAAARMLFTLEVRNVDQLNRML
ncbi:MAG: bifunctional (p)ppGpp synthetase/guanosine-3',5'-bis(diphosphate) 3'-pyrophosphohydrolase, partial [Betaproteobacteria bacterium]|nr:bifunctional (p)ppGpp synthetase/guanosine-3',5'-bis(diphosphate) 3'-pyrophosphohydrolase [Betaproteobacteria bacterium]